MSSQSLDSIDLSIQTDDWLKYRKKEIKKSALYQASKTLEKGEFQYNDVFIPCEVGKRVAGIAFLILIIIASALYNSGHFWTFPQDFMQWIHQINPVNAAIGGGITLILIGGMSWVIHRARTKVDPLLKTKRGDIEAIGNHLEVVYRKYQKENGKICYARCYVDKSTVKGEGKEKAYLFWVKKPSDHYSVSTIVTFLGTPIYFVGTIVYNLLRTVIIPFYILFQYIREKVCGTPVAQAMAPGKTFKRLTQERSFELLDIPKEMLKSVARILQAPFYALAFTAAGLYSLVNPMGGRKLRAAIELHWNDEVSLAEGYWSVGGPMELFQCEGGGGPLSLGRNGYFLAGCWQPAGMAEFQDGSYLQAYSLAHAVDPIQKNHAPFFSPSVLRNYVTSNQEALAQQTQELQSIEAELKRRK